MNIVVVLCHGKQNTMAYKKITNLIRLMSMLFFNWKVDSFLAINLIFYKTTFFSKFYYEFCEVFMIDEPSFLTFQVVHREIKSHGQTIKSIVKICDEFLGHRKFDSSEDGKKQQQRRRSSIVPSSSRNGHQDPNVGRVIERRWHCLWLRSLEWQCYLEQLCWTPKILRAKVQSFF